MTEGSIDAAELKLLSNILALVLDEQPGASVAALETLRRRAAANRVTGGALKNLFDRLATERPDETTRLRLDLDAMSVRLSRLAAENAALHQRLLEAERNWRIEMRLRRAMAGPLPTQPPSRGRFRAGLMAGALLAFAAPLLTHDRAGGLPPHGPPRPALRAQLDPGRQAAPPR